MSLLHRSPPRARSGCGWRSPGSTSATSASARAGGDPPWRSRAWCRTVTVPVSSTRWVRVYSVARIGERVWVYLAQSYRPFGTAAEYVTVPNGHAVLLPAETPFDQGAVLGIPGITGHRAIMADGPVDGQYVLVTGAIGAVGRAAIAVARRAGATVIGIVRREEDVKRAMDTGAHHVLRSNQSAEDLTVEIKDLTAGHGLDRVADLTFDTGIATYVEMAAYHAVIATYATGRPDPSLPYWPLATKNVTVRFLSNDDFPEEANQQAAAELTAALVAGDLRYPIVARYPLERIADAHEAAARSGAGRVVLDLPGGAS